MSKCVRCKLEVRDNGVMCPLCHGVLTEQEEERIGMYPDVRIKMKKLNFVFRLVIFLSVIAEIACVIVNYLTYNGIRWSVVSGLGLIYACFSLVYSAQKNKSHQQKMIVQLIVGIVFAFAIDKSLGNWGWSVSYAIPIAILAMNVGVAVLMLANANNRQSYLISQIWMTGISVACLLLDWIIGEGLPLLALIALGVSVIALAGSLVFGDRAMHSELHRRFHI